MRASRDVRLRSAMARVRRAGGAQTVCWMHEALLVALSRRAKTFFLLCTEFFFSFAACCCLFRSGWKQIARPKSFEETWPSWAPH